MLKYSRTTLIWNYFICTCFSCRSGLVLEFKTGKNVVIKLSIYLLCAGKSFFDQETKNDGISSYCKEIISLCV